jgi:predicted GH43/DUF377 family glycosyl hydrolase
MKRKLASATGKFQKPTKPTVELNDEPQAHFAHCVQPRIFPPAVEQAGGHGAMYFHSHVNHSHSNNTCPVTAPHVPFHEEPPCFEDQAIALGGKPIFIEAKGPPFFATETLHQPLSVCGDGARARGQMRVYNPGIVRNPYKTVTGHYIASFRIQHMENNNTISVSRIVLCGLTKDGQVMWTQELKDLDGVRTDGRIYMAEDGRLILVGNKLYLAYTKVSLQPHETTPIVQFKQALAVMSPTKNINRTGATVGPAYFKVHEVYQPKYGKNGQDHPGHEKNWQFFISALGLELSSVYSINPHIVIGPTGKAVVTECEAANDWTKTWGEMHGGTPPIRLADGSFITFFNSYVQHAEHQRRYVIGAYRFAGSADKYRITHITTKPLFIGSERHGFPWESPVYWEPIVMFATGAALSLCGRFVTLTVGINDCFPGMCELPMDSVMAAMMKV